MEGFKKKKKKKKKDNALVIGANNDLRRGAINLFYDSVTAEHPKIKKITDLLANYY
jgi:hypothetical protein